MIGWSARLPHGAQTMMWYRARNVFWLLTQQAALARAYLDAIRLPQIKANLLPRW
jgi:hypothetical protein